MRAVLLAPFWSIGLAQWVAHLRGTRPGEVDVTDGLLGQPRPEQLVVGVTDANDQIRLIQDVELSYPIILGSDGRVMDEMHRIARAILEGHTRIRAVQFVDEPEPDFRDSSPKDMPH